MAQWVKRPCHCLVGWIPSWNLNRERCKERTSSTQLFSEFHTCALPLSWTTCTQLRLNAIPLFPFTLFPLVLLLYIFTSINAPNSTTCCNYDLTSAIIYCCNYIFTICHYFLGLWKFYYHLPPLCCCWQLFMHFPILQTQQYIMSVIFIYLL